MMPESLPKEFTSLARSASVVSTLALSLGLTLQAGQVPEWETANPLQPLPAVPLGADVSLVASSTPPTPERVRLGRWLFFDTRLSADGTIACATCHRPGHAFSEPSPVSTGIHGQKGVRKAPPIVNLSHPVNTAFFWDGRAPTLEEQALGPIQNPVEMGHTVEGMLAALRAVAGYRPYFAAAFGSGEITAERVAHAIADYERTRLSGNSPWDRWWTGGQADALDAKARLGRQVFSAKAGCGDCHSGANFTDGQFHDIGIGWNEKTRAYADDGRGAVTKQATDRGAFKTPTLREVARRAPYMHDGSLATLKEVVAYYERGGNHSPHLDARVKPFLLSGEERAALVAFMDALSGEGFLDTPPKAFPR